MVVHSSCWDRSDPLTSKLPKHFTHRILSAACWSFRLLGHSVVSFTDMPCANSGQEGISCRSTSRLGRRHLAAGRSLQSDLRHRRTDPHLSSAGHHHSLAGSAGFRQEQRQPSIYRDLHLRSNPLHLHVHHHSLLHLRLVISAGSYE